MRPILLFIPLIAVIAASMATAGDRTKTDVLLMKNGDRITCEIKRLDHGVLTVRMDYTNTDVPIDWNKVERLESKQLFVVETRQGVYNVGTIATDNSVDNKIDIDQAGRTTEIPQPQVVTVEQLGRGFWGRMKGAFDYGFSFARSNKQTQSTLNMNLSSRTEKRYTTFLVNSLFSNTEGIQTNRHSVQTAFSSRLGYSKWSVAGVGNFLKSDQQALDLRTSLGTALERRIIYTPRSSLIAMAGPVYTYERYSKDIDGKSRFNSLEGLIGIQHAQYQFDRVELINSLWIYPSITDSGRVRSSIESSLYYKIIGNFYTRLGVYGSYDSRPPANTPKSDYGFTTSFGWSF